MTKSILGLSAFFHDSAAALIRDGKIVAAAQEERFTRKKHDPRFPTHAINYCLEEAFLDASELDAIVFYDNPLLTWDRIVQNCVEMGPTARGLFEKAVDRVLGLKFQVEELVQRSLGSLGLTGRILFAEHHLAHAASAFYPSPFARAAVLTIDGVGEWATTTIGVGDGAKLELAEELRYPHSLGLLYSAVTQYCGFKVNSGEYKLMGLAPYGRPKYEELIREHLIDLRDDGSFRLNTQYFGFLDAGTMTNEAFHRLFGGAPRTPESRITRREMDLAASVQKVCEDSVRRLARRACEQAGTRNLVMAGGVALNCVANGRLISEKVVDNLWIQPAAGDAGGALGTALLAHHLYFGEPRRLNPTGRDSQQGSYLGPKYSAAEVRAFLDRNGYPYEPVSDPDERAQKIAAALADGKIVGFLSGRMEYGPRSLGARSILGDSRRSNTQAVMNLKIKYRESFRPFAPAVLHDHVSAYFDFEGESPYMLLVAPVREERRLPNDMESFHSGAEDMLPIVNRARSDVPAITHVDYSARIQTIHPDDHPEFHRVVEAFYNLTGCAVVVNTSFNVRGEPIVCSPKDAYRCFMRTEMDLLVLEDVLLEKCKQPASSDDVDWRREFELD